MLSIFEYSRIIFLWQIVESWLAYANKSSWITQSCFLDERKTKSVPASFSCFLEF